MKAFIALLAGIVFLLVFSLLNAALWQSFTNDQEIQMMGAFIFGMPIGVMSVFFGMHIYDRL